jgi:hypothetical protein
MSYKEGMEIFQDAKSQREAIGRYEKDIAFNIIDCVIEEIQKPKERKVSEKLTVIRAERQNRLRIIEENIGLRKDKIIEIRNRVVEHFKEGNFYGRDLGEEERRAVFRYLKKQEELEKQTGPEQ